MKKSFSSRAGKNSAYPSKKKSFGSSEGRSENRRGGFKKKSFGDGENADRPFRKERGDRPFAKKSFGFKKKSFGDGENADRPFRKERGDRPFAKKSFGFKKKSFGDGENADRPFRKERGDRPFAKKSFGFKKKSFGDGENADRPFRKERGDRPFAKKSFGFKKKSFGDGENADRPFRKERGDRPFAKKSFGFKKKSFGEGENSDRPFRKERGDRPFAKKSFGYKKQRDEGDNERSFQKEKKEGSFFSKKSSYGNAEKNFSTDSDTKPSKRKSADETSDTPEIIRLNRFLANSGVGSRRHADELITMGLIAVNGESITQLGHKVKRTDDVRYNGKKLTLEKPVYILLNKPKGYITTTDDPQERQTVMALLEGATKERIYPVGRLDRNTTGLLLFTNDGDLADKLTHPSFKIKKVYKVELDKPITKNDWKQLTEEGVRLEEGSVPIDDLAIVSDDRKTIGLELHIGWNRVVRRIFESFGYEVVKLDRVVYAGLDKKNLERGQWRFLKGSEISLIKGMK